MNTFEACALLDIQPGATPEQLKAAYKKMVVKYHPDRNKDNDAESNFKRINEAYHLLDEFGTNETNYTPNSSDFLAEELRRKMQETFGSNPFVAIRPESIACKAKISFVESVLGTEKEIDISRRERCDSCNGSKNFIVNKNICHKCNGNKYRYYGKSSKKLPCVDCKATGYIGNHIQCHVCKGLGHKTCNHKIAVKVPPNTTNLSKLVLKNAGHWDSKDIYGNVVVTVNVEKEDDMHLDGQDVISIVELSLLEALQGTKRKVRTVKGEKTLAFKPNTNNRDTIKVSGFGVPPNGSHIFIVSVKYPKDTSSLIEFLSDGYEENVGVDIEEEQFIGEKTMEPES